MKYRKKPVVIHAWLLEDPDELRSAEAHAHNDGLADFMKDCEEWESSNEGVLIHTLEGTMLAQPGDYIIKGVKGEYYPCKPDIFKATYEAAQ